MVLFVYPSFAPFALSSVIPDSILLLPSALNGDALARFITLIYALWAVLRNNRQFEVSNSSIIDNYTANSL